MEQCISIEFPSTGAGTDDERYAAWPLKGEWLVTEVYFAPATTAAANATNYLTLTVSTSDGAAGAATSLGTLTTATVAMTVGTSREVSISGAGLAIQQGYQIKVAKTEAGTGAVLDGCVTVVAEKIP